MESASRARVCGPGDIDTVVGLLVGAFHDDPSWSAAFPDASRRPGQLWRLWRLLVEGAMRYPGVWLNADDTATAVWIPPGGSELSEQQEVDLEAMLVEMLGPGATRVLSFFAAFDAAHPRHEPHYYLTLLGTDVSHRGQGHGLQLLADTLSVVDEAGAAAYLEASNPVNVPLYARYGFEVFGSVALPDGAAEVTTMWRSGRSTR